MQNWQISNRQTQRIDFLLFDRFSNHCLANALEPLRAANSLLGRDAYAWRFLTLGDVAVTSSSGLPVMPTALLQDRPRGDALFVVSSYGYRDLATDTVSRTLRAAAGRYDVLVGLDTGSWLLAAAGLLEGRSATIHFDVLEAFAERFPETRVERTRCLEDGNRWSSGGAMAAFELVLHMIGQAHGAALTLEIGALFMHDTILPPRDLSGAGRDRVVARALVVMKEHSEDVLPISEVAKRSGCHQRQLEERFRRSLGAPPLQVYRHLRLTKAKRMIETEPGISIAEVAGRCGFANAASFSRAFRGEFGVAPRSLR